MASTKNFRHGRLRVVSGDSVPLVYIVDLDVGDMKWDEGTPANIVKSRGRQREVTRGDEQPIAWGFSAMFVDKRLYRVIRDKVWPDQTQTVTVTANSLNADEPVTYPYEQGSLLVTTAGSYTKGAVDSVPGSSGQYSEPAGAEDVEGVIKVADTSGTAATFDIYAPAAVTSIAITYDAVGQGTAGAAADLCQGGVKTFDLILDIYDPCDPPDPDDLDAGTVVERYAIRDAFAEQFSFQEGEDSNKVTFAGRSIGSKVEITTV